MSPPEAVLPGVSPIDRALQLFQRLPQDDDELRSEWSKYLTIIVASFLETEIRNILSEYVASKSEQRIARFANRNIDGFRNPNPDRIKDLVHGFDERWAEQLNDFWKDGIRDSVRSLVNLRNSAAHGRSFTASWNDIIRYAGDARRLRDFFKDLVERS
jgi:hypothetical protein